SPAGAGRAYRASLLSPRRHRFAFGRDAPRRRDRDCEIGFEGAVGTLAGFGSRRAHTRAVVQVRGSASRIAASRFRKIAEDNEAMCRIVVRYGEMLLIQVQ